MITDAQTKKSPVKRAGIFFKNVFLRIYGRGKNEKIPEPKLAIETVQKQAPAIVIAEEEKNTPKNGNGRTRYDQKKCRQYHLIDVEDESVEPTNGNLHENKKAENAIDLEFLEAYLKDIRPD